MRRLLVLAFVIAAAGGCSLLTDTSNLSGGGGSKDSGAPSTTAADASSTGEGGAGPSTTDAGSDAAMAGEWCKVQPDPAKACFDFDVGDLTGVELQLANGNVTLDTEASSPPHSLYAVMDKNKTGNAYASLPLMVTPVRATFAFDISLDASAGTYVEFNAMHFHTSSDQYCGIEPALNEDAIEIDEYCTAPGSGTALTVRHVLMPFSGTSGWYSITVNLDFTARTVAATIHSPDSKMATLPATTLDPKMKTGQAFFLAGVSYAPAAAPPPRVRVDNLRIDFP